MHAAYTDIIEAAGRPPIWWQADGVPRFCAFAPGRVPDIYADEAACLVRPAVDTLRKEKPMSAAPSAVDIVKSYEGRNAPTSADIAALADQLEAFGGVHHEDTSELNAAVHACAPMVDAGPPPDYLRSLDASEAFSCVWAAPHTGWDHEAQRWSCQLKNAIGIDWDGCRGSGENEAIARLVAHLRCYGRQLAYLERARL